MATTGYPIDRIHFVKGPVEETIPGEAPDAIAILRLDTDWYESTRHELAELYPRVADRGVLIVDDYGHFAGSREGGRRVLRRRAPVLLNRIDYAGRIALKA